MPLTEVRNVGDVGLVTDRAPTELPPNAWTGVQNVRFDRTGASVRRGAQQVLGTPQVTPIFLESVAAMQNLYWVYTDGESVYAVLGETHHDITGSLTFNGDVDNRWDFVWLNGVLLVNSKLDAPAAWSSIDHSVSLSSLSNWPTDYRVGVLRGFKNFAIALDVTKSGTRFPTTVLWSHPADPGAVPESWDVTDASYLAGEVALSETSGFILDGLALGDQFVIYKEDAIILMQYVGGNSVFRTISIPGGLGIMAKGCVTQVDRGAHALISNEGMPYLFDGQKTQPIADTIVAEEFQRLATLGYKHRSFVVYDPQEREVWFCLAGETEYPEVAYVYSMTSQVWTFRDFNSATDAALGVFTPEDSIGTWDQISDAWDESDNIWNAGRESFASQDNLVLAHPDLNALYQWQVRYTVAGEGYEARLERQGLSVYGQTAEGQARVEFTRVKLVTELWPLVELAPGTTMDVQIGAQESLGGSVVWRDRITFDPSVDEKINVLEEGKYIAVRFFLPSESRGRLIGYRLQVGNVGKYF